MDNSRRPHRSVGPRRDGGSMNQSARQMRGSCREWGPRWMPREAEDRPRTRRTRTIRQRCEAPSGPRDSDSSFAGRSWPDEHREVLHRWRPPTSADLLDHEDPWTEEEFLALPVANRRIELLDGAPGGPPRGGPPSADVVAALVRPVRGGPGGLRGADAGQCPGGAGAHPDPRHRRRHHPWRRRRDVRRGRGRDGRRDRQPRQRHGRPSPSASLRPERARRREVPDSRKAADRREPSPAPFPPCGKNPLLG